MPDESPVSGGALLLQGFDKYFTVDWKLSRYIIERREVKFLKRELC